LLLKHWDDLKISDDFVRAALYVATPTLRKLAHEQLATRDPKPLFKYFTMRYGIRVAGHPGVTRIEQLEVLEPYLEHLEPHHIQALWNLCNERGWYDLRRRFFDTPLKKPTIEGGRSARPKLGTGGEAFRRAHPSHRCWRISICAGSCWDGRSSGWRKASARGS
jgi:hypothetical protein